MGDDRGLCAMQAMRLHTLYMALPLVHHTQLPRCPAHTLPSPSALLCSRLLAHGEEHMEGVRREFMWGYPDTQAPLRHTARARLVCLRRLPATAASL
jgi:hypothetical protein